MNYHARYEHAGDSSYDALIAGNAHLLVARKVMIAAGQPLPRGAVIGENHSTGDFELATNAGAVPSLILAEAVDGLARREALAYSRGDFNFNALTLSANLTLAHMIETLRFVGIVVLPAMV